MFWRKSKVIVDCYTFRKSTVGMFSIQPLTKLKPKWFKDMPNFRKAPPSPGSNRRFKVSNFKSCAGFINLFRVGFGIPLWTDFQIINERAGLGVKYPDTYTTVEPHLEPHEDVEYNMATPLSDNHRHVKLNSPWLCFSEQDVDFLMVGAEWNYVNHHLYDFNIPMGIVNFKHQASSNINIMFPRNVDGRETQFQISAGDIIAYLIPLTERKVEFRCHYIPTVEWNQLHMDYESKTISARNGYFNMKKLWKNR
jgi:hypothetical protein